MTVRCQLATCSFNESDLFQVYGVQLPPNANLLYAESVSDWSWGAVLIVWQEGNSFYINESDEWKPKKVSQEDALARMLDFEEML